MTQSPCRNCNRQKEISSGCYETCEILHEVQTMAINHRSRLNGAADEIDVEYTVNLPSTTLQAIGI